MSAINRSFAVRRIEGIITNPTYDTFVSLIGEVIAMYSEARMYLGTIIAVNSGTVEFQWLNSNITSKVLSAQIVKIIKVFMASTEFLKTGQFLEETPP